MSGNDNRNLENNSDYDSGYAKLKNFSCKKIKTDFQNCKASTSRMDDNTIDLLYAKVFFVYFR